MNDSKRAETPKQQVAEVLERFRSGWEERDSERVLSTLSHRPDLIVYGTDANEKWIGYDSLVEPFRTMSATYSSPTYEWSSDEPRISVEAEVAWACGDLHVSLGTDTGRVSFLMRSTFVLFKEASGWRIAHGHFSVPYEGSVAPYAS